ncbi:MAG: hypothetical protein A3H63_00290 [Candidatus Harrisonbacteria bacterium RIFCSPLOWO2_02_FULL_45_10c]|uniref:Phosphatidic acid phosphatase type 2/haloperoxidase domain-containing protein n=1 Tax=Candidatus Harrisonbacteria bacterium RIFCSPLOWO2_02_FULL_45_10c TaxID=1798410 RepID=A0A1G1ZWA6_9BACT|nr:MAG: hypothetical protein A3H63_00290 [Candidatus Harrisonbacteria bacterium RIFCSPLOWO2_02_FULL_45_10c]
MDEIVFKFINGFAGKSQWLDFAGIFFADYFGYLLIAGVAYLIFSAGDWRKKFQNSAFIILSTIISRGIITEIIRFFYNRPRPFIEFGNLPLIDQANVPALPSGHAAFYFALVLPVFFINKKFGWYGVAGAALMGVARIFVGVHWPLDIVAGALVALLSVFIVHWLLVSRKT